MKINLLNKKNFGKKIIILSVFITAVIMFLLIENLVQIKKNQLQALLLGEESIAENILLDRFNSTFLIIDKITKEIAVAPDDKKHIKAVLDKYKTDSSFNDIFSWTIFSWADQNLQVTVDGQYGIMNNPFDLSIRDYAQESMSYTGKMLLGKPVFGSTSKQWMIPGGVGIKDQNDKFLGIANVGFNIGNLARMIRENISNENINIDLVYKDQYPVLSVSKSSIKVFSQEEINNIKSYDQDQNKEISLNKKLDNYPYHLILKYNQKAINNILWNVIYSRLIELIAIMSLLASLLFIIYRSEKTKREKIACLMQREVEIGKSKTEFMLRISHELMNFIAAIIGLSNIVKEDLKEKGSLNDEKIEEGIEHLEHIEDISEELRSFVVDLIDLNQIEDGKFEIQRSNNKIDFEDMIERSLRILKSKIKNKNIVIETDFDNNLHKLTHLDPRRIKQVLVGIIGNAINHSSQNSKIEIIARNVDKKKISIVIKDCGSGISEDKISEILANYDANNYPNNRSGSIEIKLPIIRFLIEKQNGTIKIQSNKNYGTEVIITL